jgi:phosphoribosyl 1,2-cyclic phosphate phosphodiesterase
MSYKLTLLGTGSSGGVPRLGNHWGACDPTNPRNRRRRCAALIERFSGRGTTRVLIDTPPDLREQLLEAGVGTVDAVLYTHDHADHTHGIDELRVLAFNMKRRVDVHFDARTKEVLMSRFRYCFETPTGSSYPAILNAHEISPPRTVRIDGGGGPVELIPIVQQHGDISSLGFRIGNVAYSPDVSGLSQDAAKMLAGLDVWILDALRYTPHPSHWSVSQALEWIESLAPKRAILTHLHVDLDYDKLKRELPEHVAPAYDGMAVFF